MSDDSETFKVDLDASGFVSGANDALESLNSLGSSEGLSGLISGLESVAPVLGVIGVAFFSLKGIMDAVFDAENINAVNNQFQMLAENAGVMPEKLKAGMEEASHGLLTTQEVLQSTNKALVELETGFDKLPELMELARKVSAVMGGDVSARFDDISRAVATGQTRLLRTAGIMIDQKKAYLDYANSIGQTVDSLSKAGQQQAILNAVLEQGQSKFGAVNVDIKEAANTWQQLKVTVAELGEGFEIMIDKIAGPTVKAALHAISDQFSEWGNRLKADFGSGADQAAAKIALLKTSIERTSSEIAALEKQNNESNLKDFDDTINARLKKLQDYKAAYEKQLSDQVNQEKLIKQQLENQQKTKQANDGAGGVSSVDQEKILTRDAKFNSDMAKLKQDRANTDKQIDAQNASRNTSVEEATKLYQKSLIDQESVFNQQIAKLEADKIKIRSEEGKSLTSGQVLNETRAINDQIVELNKLKDLKIKQNDQDLWKSQEQSLNNLVNQSSGATDAIANSFKKMSADSSHDMVTGIKIGQEATQTFSTNMSGAFKSIGDGSKSATQAMGDAFAGMAGDMASHYGEVMFLASVWPPDPAGLAAGAALMALGGALGGLAGGSSSSASASASPSASSGSSSSPSSPSTPSTLNQASAQTNPTKSVSLVIQGNMLGTDQSNRWLVDQIRNASDATDFTIKSVNGGF